MFKVQNLLIIWLWLCTKLFTNAFKFNEILSSKMVEFQWPDMETRARAEMNGLYIPGHNVPLGLDRWNDKLFITVPRWKNGGASSLNYVDLKRIGENKSLPLIPYPNWDANTLPTDDNINPSKIINTFRVKVDECDRLWIMDAGKTDVFSEKPALFLPPGIVIYDLKTDQFIRRHHFDEKDVKDESFFTNIVIDTDKDNCDQAFAYITDPNAQGLMVYSYAADDSWRVEHHFFHFDPLNGDFNVGGVNFQWSDGVFGLALSPKNADGYRTIYFHPTASTKEFTVSTEVLQNKTAALSEEKYYQFKFIGERGMNTHSSTSVMDPYSGVIFYSQIQRDGIACWNTKRPLNPESFHLIIHNPQTMVFANEVKIDQDNNIWMMSNRMPQFLYKQLNFDDINFRIFMSPVNDILTDSPCV
ncbi:protein yellow-like [Chrysoperla carnea]|uniref:protein yellow-like n=1 Tax=Chrysoperla carnea TaxID=189513 RepID=UPI001D08FC7D|nr:protein yellow-like [Chrysoperla carnea]